MAGGQRSRLPQATVLSLTRVPHTQIAPRAQQPVRAAGVCEIRAVWRWACKVAHSMDSVLLRIGPPIRIGALLQSPLNRSLPFEFPYSPVRLREL